MPEFDYIKSLLIYDEQSPMIFTRFYFWGFFAIVLALYSLVYRNKGMRNAYLFFVSLFFYYKTSGLFLFILIFSTVADFCIGHAIYRSSSVPARRWLIALSVGVNLCMLSYFKYTGFIVDNVNHIFGTDFRAVNFFAQWANIFTGSEYEVGRILLPVGISFFTFQTISYSVDIYRGYVKPVKNLADFGFYVSFFPQLVSGPIVRASEFIPQLYRDYSLTKRDFGLAAYMILKGLVKKIVIGDYIAVNFIDRVFENPTMFTGLENLLSLYAYSLQVYCDFSGYTDMAIGVALLMGFQLPTNFNSPYKATNVGDFWKRWHMSLSNWLKDYLYIPMGGNRGGSYFTWIMVTVIGLMIVLLSGSVFTGVILTGIAALFVALAILIPGIRTAISNNINLMVTMLLGGLWHGSSWQFVIWGGLNGAGLIVYKFWKKISPWENRSGWLVHFWRIFLTFSFITFTRIWFRSETMETSYLILSQISGNFQLALAPDILISYYKVFILMTIGFVFHWLPSTLKDRWMNWFIATALWLKVVIVTAVVFLVYQAMSADLQPFIYFQF